LPDIQRKLGELDGGGHGQFGLAETTLNQRTCLKGGQVDGKTPGPFNVAAVGVRHTKFADTWGGGGGGEDLEISNISIALFPHVVTGMYQL